MPLPPPTSTPIPTLPTLPITPKIIPPVEGIPLFSAPIANGQCISAVKNLDDPKLFAYYDDLKIINRKNVHRSISRVEFIKLVLNAAKLDLSEFENADNIKDFTDIDQKSWYAPYIAYMVASDTMSGQEILDENGNTIKIFRPNAPISRAEASKILSELVRKKDQKLPTIDEIISFEDVNPKEPLSPYIQFAYNSCLLHGRNTIDGQPIDGKPRVFEPFDRITLAETSKVLYNITHSNTDENAVFAENIDALKSNFLKMQTSNSLTGQNIQPSNTDDQKNGTITSPVLMPVLTVNGQNFTLNSMLQKIPK